MKKLLFIAALSFALIPPSLKASEEFHEGTKVCLFVIEKALIIKKQIKDSGPVGKGFMNQFSKEKSGKKNLERFHTKLKAIIDYSISNENIDKTALNQKITEILQDSDI